MEVHASPFRHRPSIDPIRTETALMAIDDSHDDLSAHDDKTPIFREPDWTPNGRSPADGSARPVLLQPSTSEDGMKQHDKNLVARLDRGSSSSESGSPTDADKPTQLQSPQSLEQERPGNSQGNSPQRRSSQVLPLPPQPRQDRPHHQQKRPAPLTLRPTSPDPDHQPPRLPSLIRLVASNEQQSNQPQRPREEAQMEESQAPDQSQHAQQPQQPRKQSQQHAQYQAQQQYTQSARRYSRVAKPNTIQSPNPYRAFTPIQVVPSWQGVPYGWTPMSMPFQMQMPGPVAASPHQVFSPQMQRPPYQHYPTPTPNSTPTSARPVQGPQLREDLWKVGGQYLSQPATADAWVRAVEIRHGSMLSNIAASPQDDQMDVDNARPDSPDPYPDASPNPFGNTLLLRIVIHSPGRASMAMTREFDRSKLRDTIPDFARSPKSPKSGSSTGTVASGGAVSTPVNAVSHLSLARRRKSQIRAQHQAGTPTSPSSAGPIKRLTMPPVPIHLPFARAHSPALAAVLMMRELHKGDSVDLPMPFPGAWLETSAYMYTGNEELLSERVKQNLWYLGGVPV